MDGLPGADLPIADAIKLLYQTAKDLWTIRVSSSLNTAYLLTDFWTKFVDGMQKNIYIDTWVTSVPPMQLRR